MNTKRIIANLEFGSVLNTANGATQTGNELLNKYKSFLMANESSCGLVNSFVREAQNCRYDNDVNAVLESVANYINENKTSWALATACESIMNNNSSYNYLNRNAAKQVENLLEMNESDVVKYIKAGALKNVMFCEAFRNIAKQVFKSNPIVEANAEYTKITPVSLVESVEDGHCFCIAGALYKINSDKMISEADWSEVSNTFKTIEQLMESNLVSVDEHDITISAANAKYTINEAGKVTKEFKGEKQEMTVEQLRENTRLVLMATSGKMRNQLAGILEAVALTCENYDNILNLDNAAIYMTKSDKFLVIESGDNIYSTLLQSSRHSKWTINEGAVSAVAFIKSKTNVSLNEDYKANIESNMNNIDEADRNKVESELMEQTKASYAERIVALTEKFKDDPVKLAVLSKLASQVGEMK